MVNKSEKKSFVMMLDLLDPVELMSKEEAGEFLKAIISYWKDEEVNLPRHLQFAFMSIKNQFDRDWEKYKKACKNNRLNGRLGGRPKNPKKPSGLIGNPENPDKDTDKDTDKEKEKIKGKKFKIPIFEEVSAYCQKRSNHVDPEAFINHYESNGWKVGKNGMKSWQAAVRTWEKTSKSNNHGYNQSAPHLKEFP